jgi:hypothetical protein
MAGSCEHVMNLWFPLQARNFMNNFSRVTVSYTEWVTKTCSATVKLFSNIQIEVFWIMTPCSDAVGYQSFGDLTASIFRVKCSTYTASQPREDLTKYATSSALRYIDGSLFCVMLCVTC